MRTTCQLFCSKTCVRVRVRTSNFLRRLRIKITGDLRSRLVASRSSRLWALRKKVCDDVVRAGDDEIAGRVLGHSHVDNT